MNSTKKKSRGSSSAKDRRGGSDSENEDERGEWGLGESAANSGGKFGLLSAVDESGFLGGNYEDEWQEAKGKKNKGKGKGVAATPPPPAPPPLPRAPPPSIPNPAPPARALLHPNGPSTFQMKAPVPSGSSRTNDVALAAITSRMALSIAAPAELKPPPPVKKYTHTPEGRPIGASYYRSFQKCWRNERNGEVILKFHKTDIVVVKSDGSVVLNSNGYLTHTTMLSMNDGLQFISFKVLVGAGGGGGEGWEVRTPSIGTLKYKDNMVIPPSLPADRDRARLFLTGMSALLADHHQLQHGGRGGGGGGQEETQYQGIYAGMQPGMGSNIRRGQAPGPSNMAPVPPPANHASLLGPGWTTNLYEPSGSRADTHPLPSALGGAGGAGGSGVGGGGVWGLAAAGGGGGGGQEGEQGGRAPPGSMAARLAASVKAEVEAQALAQAHAQAQNQTRGGPAGEMYGEVGANGSGQQGGAEGSGQVDGGSSFPSGLGGGNHGPMDFAFPNASFGAEAFLPFLNAGGGQLPMGPGGSSAMNGMGMSGNGVQSGVGNFGSGMGAGGFGGGAGLLVGQGLTDWYGSSGPGLNSNMMSGYYPNGQSGFNAVVGGAEGDGSAGGVGSVYGGQMVSQGQVNQGQVNQGLPPSVHLPWQQPTWEPPTNQGAAPAHEEDDDLCIVCMENARDTILIPCSHLLLCQGCAEKIVEESKENRQCPLCRVEVDTMLPIFG